MMKSSIVFPLSIMLSFCFQPLCLAQDLDNIAQVESRSVDRYYQIDQMLEINRGNNRLHESDSCQAELADRNNFASRIVYFVNQHIEETLVPLEGLSSYFKLPKDVQSFQKVSLISHPLCQPELKNLKSDLKKIPSAKLIQNLNQMVVKLNSARAEALKGSPDAAVANWSKLMMCLSYVESLTTADTPSSDQVARKILRSGVSRPEGVLFYEDPLQPEVSRLNIGLFQFTPDISGNIRPCVQEWNRHFPKCYVPIKSDKSEYINLLGSNAQSFNSFCGVNKVLQTFSVQVNTSSSVNTSAANLQSDGKVKIPQDRCVTLQMTAGKAYNHFGPFQNSTSENLQELVNCFLDSN